MKIHAQQKTCEIHGKIPINIKAIGSNQFHNKFANHEK